MSFLIQQTELNDCGPAICTMVLKQVNLDWSLEQFKVEHHYNHQQFSFQQIEECLVKHGIKVLGYQFTSLAELQEIKTFSCFQIINKWGQYHFVLAKYLNNKRWLIYDPTKASPLIWNEVQFLSCTTKMVQIFNFEKVKITKGLKVKLFKTLIKNNLISILVSNFLLILNLLIMVIVNSFLRIIFQDYQFITLQRTFLLLIMLVGLIGLNAGFQYLMKSLNLFFTNKFFKKIIRLKNFEMKFQQGIEFLNLQDFEKSYFQFQTNLLSLITIVNQVLGLICFSGFLGFYFFKTNKILFLSSFFLVIFLGTIKFWKLKTLQNQTQKIQNNQKLYLLDFHLLTKNSKAIFNKTTLINYLELKELNNLLSFKLPKISERFHFLERFLIYFYYLVLCLLLDWHSQSISLLIIFTSMTIVLNSQMEQIFNAYLTYKPENYFNNILVSKPINFVKEKEYQITFKKHLLKNNFLIIKQTELNQIFINYLPIKRFTSEIYFANEALNFDEIIYHNIFNYQKVNWNIFKQEKITEFLDAEKINLEGYIAANQEEMIKYLSCFFAIQQIIVLNLPKDFALVEKLTNCFSEKTFIFLENEIKI